jgi:hypothetical protein
MGHILGRGPRTHLEVETGTHLGEGRGHILGAKTGTHLEGGERTHLRVETGTYLGVEGHILGVEGNRDTCTLEHYLIAE